MTFQIRLHHTSDGTIILWRAAIQILYGNTVAILFVSSADTEGIKSFPK